MIQAAEQAAAAPRPPSRPRFIAIAILGPLTLAMLALWFGIQLRELDTMRSVVRASYDKRYTAVAFLRELDEAESAQRGYIVTGQAQFLTTYDEALRRTRGDLAKLGTFYDNDPAQVARLVQLRQVIDAKFAEMGGTIVQRRAGRLDAAAARVSDRQGMMLMTRARDLALALTVAEQAALGYRVNYIRGHYDTLRKLAWVSMLFAGVALLAALWSIWRTEMERFRIEQGAHASATLLHAIFASTTDAILIIDPAGRVHSANAATGRLFGCAPAELVGQDAAPLIGLCGEDDECDFAERIGLVDGRLTQPNRLERTVRHRQGDAIPVDIGLGTMPQPDGVHIVAAMRDVSERRAAERLKDEFVSTVSHELRTPLTSVVGSLGLLRSGSVGELPDAAKRLVEIAENNSRRLIRLINDILDIEKIGSGRMHFDSVPLDLVRMLESAIEGSQGLAATKRVSLALAADERPLIVLGDGERLLQVVTNLLSNAIRFSPEDGAVRVEVGRDDDDALIAVEDEGPGIPADFSGRIFERFSQASSGAAMSGGTGLGLAISREIISAHGGRIWFGEAKGGGARLAFSLPLPPPDPRAQSARPRILVCQSHPEAADSVREMLERDGCLVDCVGTAREASLAARSGRYDGLILDVILPDENGLEVVRTLRRRADTRLLPIIVVSGLADDGAAALEVVDWIDKPVDQERLIRAVRRAVEHSATTRPTLLHIDDDLDMLEVTATALADQGRILRATTISDARALLAEQTPDIVILDVGLPDGSGLELLPDLLLADGTAIPTIIYSASDVLPEFHKQVDAVLVKSRRSLPNLAQAIRRLLAAASTEDAR